MWAVLGMLTVQVGSVISLRGSSEKGRRKRWRDQFYFICGSHLRKVYPVGLITFWKVGRQN